MGHQTSSDPNVFILPDLGEGVHEAELIAWKVAPGETVEEHQTLAEMETDKALVEVPSPRAGVIETLHGEEGQILKVGEPLVTYAPAGGQAAGQPAERKSAQAAPAAGADNGASDAAPARADADADEDAGTVVGSLSASSAVSGGGKALATPAVRRLARDLGVDINAIQGTGIAGRVTDRDVRAAAAGGAPPAAQAPARGRMAAYERPSAEPAESAPAPRASAKHAPAAPSPNGPAAAPARPTQPEPKTAPASAAAAAPASPAPAAGAVERVPIRGTRRKIAERLRQSVDTAVHFLVMEDADVSRLDDARKRLSAASGEKLSFLPFVMAAVCRALRACPELNATVDEEAGEILQHGSMHLGVATDTEHGLNVPVIRDADRLGVLQLARAVADLAQRARQRTIAREELAGSTFTVSNLGSQFGRFYGPVINHPEVALLATGRVREGVIARDGAIRIAKIMPLTIACDHRIVDGAEGARFLERVISLLEGNPDELLAPARA